MKLLFPVIILLSSLLTSVIPTSALLGQTDGAAPILFIYDASGSMWGKLNNATKKDVAAEVFVSTIDALNPEQKIGFMVYGHRSKGDCKDVELMVNLENTSKSILKSNIEKLTPLGKTPLAYSAKLAIEATKKTNTKATIILVTDGIESCDGDLCEVIRLARVDGIEFKMHIVGFGLKDGDTEALKCAAKEGGGNYYDASDANQLSKVLDSAVNQKIDDPEPNHTFYSTKNGKSIDSWIKIIDKGTGKEMGAVRTYRDSAKMYLPHGDYSLTINPLEGTDIASKTLELSKTKDGPFHNTISFDGGAVAVFISNNNEGWDATVKVIDRQTKKVIGSRRTYGRKTTIEVNSGNYDVEIIPLTIKGQSLKYTFENISVKANETNNLSHDYNTGTLLIGVSTKSGDLVDASINITDSITKTNIAGGRTYTSASSNPKAFILQPGTYEIKIQTLGKHKGVVKTETVTVDTDKESLISFQID